MILILQKILKVITRTQWAFLGIILIVLFFSSWASMSHFESPAPISEGKNFWWYFLVTFTTVGYGDLFPITTGGRITGGIIMWVGIGLGATLLAKIAELVIKRREKHMKGLVQLKVEDHILILGWNERTGAVIKEILANTPNVKETIVLVSQTLTENPRPGDIEFVHGCPAAEETLIKACASKAKNIIVYGTDDNKTFAYGAAANWINPEAHIVAYFCHEENAVNLKRVNGRIECVTSFAVPLLVHAMSDPGSPSLITNLASHDDKGTSYRINVPLEFEGAHFNDLLLDFKRKYNAILIGAARSWLPQELVTLNPKGKVTGGMSLFYIADERLENISWTEL